MAKKLVKATVQADLFNGNYRTLIEDNHVNPKCTWVLSNYKPDSKAIVRNYINANYVYPSTHSVFN